MATVRTRAGTGLRRRRARPERSAREWRYTTVTGVALLVLVLVHMVAHHFVVDGIGGLRTYDQVLDYIENPWMFTIESLFLLFVTAHAMLGLRSVLYDLDPSAGSKRWIDRGLWALGLVTVAYGLFLLGTLASRA